MRFNLNQNYLNNITLNNDESPSKDITKNLARIKSYGDNKKWNLNTQALKIQQLRSYYDRSFAFYSAVVEAVMLKAQELTSLALERLKILKGL